MTATTTRTRQPLSKQNLLGLQLAILLGLADVVGTFAIPGPDGAEEGPPAGVQALGLVLGLLTIGLAIWAWRTSSRRIVRAVVGIRVLSAITGLPAFFVDVDAWIKVVTAVFVLLTIACVVLTLRPAGRRTPVTD